MKIVYVGNFNPLSVGEPEIASCLEDLGHEVVRISEYGTPISDVWKALKDADLLLFAKFRVGTINEMGEVMAKAPLPKICWNFDLLIGI